MWYNKNNKWYKKKTRIKNLYKFIIKFVTELNTF